MINSLNNQKVKQIVNLQQKAKVRNEEDAFVVEGVKMFLEAPQASIDEVYVLDSYYDSMPSEVLEKVNQSRFEVVSEAVFDKMSDTKTPQGILCVMKQFHYDLNSILQKLNQDKTKKPLLVFLEDIQDPGNLGTIMRTSEGAGVDAVLMTRRTVDIYNPKTIRATMGSIYRVPFLYIEETASTLALFRQYQIQIYAAHLKGTQYYDALDYREGTAFLIGNEGNGLTEETAALADTYLRIPMQGQLESLNAGVATALLIYEADRQRRNNIK